MLNTRLPSFLRCHPDHLPALAGVASLAFAAASIVAFCLSSSIRRLLK
jgi:hypothetical protein